MKLPPKSAKLSIGIITIVFGMSLESFSLDCILNVMLNIPYMRKEECEAGTVIAKFPFKKKIPCYCYSLITMRKLKFSYIASNR